MSQEMNKQENEQQQNNIDSYSQEQSVTNSEGGNEATKQQSQSQFQFRQEEVNQDMPQGSYEQQYNNQENNQVNGQYYDQYNAGYDQNYKEQSYHNVENPYQYSGQQEQNSYQNQNPYQNQNQNEQKPKSPFDLFKEQGKLPTIKTDEDARNVYYGINAPYYQDQYKKYKKGQKISWNWCAFLFNAYWFFSRKMYVIGSLCAVAMAMISFAIVQIANNLTQPKIAVMLFPWAVAFFGVWVMTGLFANYIYLSHMENKIIYPSENKESNEKMVQLNVMRGGFSIYGILVGAVATDLIGTILQALIG